MSLQAAAKRRLELQSLQRSRWDVREGIEVNRTQHALCM